MSTANNKISDGCFSISFIPFILLAVSTTLMTDWGWRTRRRTASHLVARWERAPRSQPIRPFLCPALGLALSLCRAPALAPSRAPSRDPSLALGLFPGRAPSPSPGRVRGLSRARVQTTCSASCLCAKIQLQRKGQKDKTRACSEQGITGRETIGCGEGWGVAEGQGEEGEWGTYAPGEMGEVV